jgi:2'-5' RNA ligase
MSYAVVFYLDPIKAAPLQAVINELGSKNIAPYMHNIQLQPHITLAIYDRLECQVCEQKIAAFAKEVHGFNLLFSSIGIFDNTNPVVFAAPTLTRALLELHQRLHTLLEDEAHHPWEIYKPGLWVPHCSLAVEFPQQNLYQALEICLQLELPLQVPVSTLGVMQFEPISPLYDYPLKK